MSKIDKKYHKLSKEASFKRNFTQKPLERLRSNKADAW